MRAIVVSEFGGPEVMELGTRPDPRPGPGQVLVEVHAAGVNPVDTYIRSGWYAKLPELPFVPGWDGAGRVLVVGAGVAALAEGDRVYFSGTASGRAIGSYAELAVCGEVQVFPLPDRLSYAQGASIGVPYATAYRALFQRGNARSGEWVLIHGASGAVGTAAVQLARVHGLTVIGTAGTPDGVALVQREGAHHGVLHGTPESAALIRGLTQGRGVDLIIEMLANRNLDTDLSLLANHGRVVVVGNRGRVEIDPRQTMARESTILGVSLWHASDLELREVHLRMAPDLAGGLLTPVVGRSFPLGEAAQAHREILAGGARGQLVLAVR
ncbi:MAG: NADPH:quinone reductase [Gemmatimonadota bacterium]